MRYSSFIFFSMVIGGTVSMISCKDNKSYAELLTDETHAVNNFLANQDVIMELPENGDFIEGKDAPYYRLDEDGNVYMQIIDSGDKNQMAEDDELIYFRFTRYSLYNYNPATGEMNDGWGNSDDLSVGAASFRFGNYMGYRRKFHRLFRFSITCVISSRGQVIIPTTAQPNNQETYLYCYFQ